jgi:hypothetical protein
MMHSAVEQILRLRCNVQYITNRNETREVGLCYVYIDRFGGYRVAMICGPATAMSASGKTQSR